MVAGEGMDQGWGPGGRRFKSCLPTRQRAREHGPFAYHGGGGSMLLGSNLGSNVLLHRHPLLQQRASKPPSLVINVSLPLPAPPSPLSRAFSDALRHLET